MVERVSVTASDGHTFDAWRSDPVGDVKGGIIFLQAIYGLTTHLGDVCDQFAGDGYAAMAPALYDRAGRNTVFDYDQAGLEGGMAFREHLAEETVLLDVAACADTLRPTAGKVAIAGFCTGGTWAWVSASALAAGCRRYFLRNRHPRLSRPPCAMPGDDALRRPRSYSVDRDRAAD